MFRSAGQPRTASSGEVEVAEKADHGGEDAARLVADGLLENC
jgi:hypothetical protein